MFASKLWIGYVTATLKQTQPCTTHFMIGRHLLEIFQEEVVHNGRSVEYGGFDYQCFDYPGNPQAFDTVYAACNNFDTITENNRVYVSPKCLCTNRAFVALHTWIIPPCILTPEQAEIYAVFRKDGTPPATALEIAQNI